jgi:hypothetical protein
VFNFLTAPAQGVAANRLTQRGFGETRPIGDNATEAGKALNRRVELNVQNQRLTIAAIDAGGTVLTLADGEHVFPQGPIGNIQVWGDPPQWQALHGDLSLTEFYAVAYEPTSNVLIGGTQDNGDAVQALGGGQQWSALIYGDFSFFGDGGIVHASDDGFYYNIQEFGSFTRTSQEATLAGNPALTFRDNGPGVRDTIVRAAGDWLVDGFGVTPNAHFVTVTGTAFNAGVYRNLPEGLVPAPGNRYERDAHGLCRLVAAARDRQRPDRQLHGTKCVVRPRHSRRSADAQPDFYRHRRRRHNRPRQWRLERRRLHRGR